MFSNGRLLIFAGVVFLLIGLFADTTISTESGEVYNIGLMDERRNYLILGGFLLIAGVILFSKNSKNQDGGNEENLTKDREDFKDNENQLLEKISFQTNLTKNKLNKHIKTEFNKNKVWIKELPNNFKESLTSTYHQKKLPFKISLLFSLTTSFIMTLAIQSEEFLVGLFILLFVFSFLIIGDKTTLNSKHSQESLGIKLLSLTNIISYLFMAFFVVALASIWINYFGFFSFENIYLLSEFMDTSIDWVTLNTYICITAIALAFVPIKLTRKWRLEFE